MAQNLWQGPATDAKAVTASDNADLTPGCRGLHVGGAGDVAGVLVDAAGGSSAVTFKGCTAGQVLPYAFRRVYSTNTTATNLVALY